MSFETRYAGINRRESPNHSAGRTWNPGRGHGVVARCIYEPRAATRDCPYRNLLVNNPG